MTQIITFFVVILALAITIVIGRTILNRFYLSMDTAIAGYVPSRPNMTSAQILSAQLAMNATEQSMKNNIISSYATFDYALAVLAIVFIIGGIISSFLIPSHPIFLVINIIGIFVLIFIGMIMTNVYAEMVSGQGSAYLGDAADNFSLINYIMQYLPYIGAIMVAICSIVMFARGM